MLRPAARAGLGVGFAVSAGLSGCGREPEPATNAPSLRSELPRLAPLTPEAALAAFELTPGYRIELVAAEPLVVDPVDLEFGADGRLWVVEMIDYPFDGRDGKEPRGRVRVLDDTDGDGRMDESRVFASGLSWPTGLALWKNGVFVAAAPDILWLEDTDGDGRADMREAVFTGFGTHNVQALLNNLEWSPTGWFHGAGGGNGGEIRSTRWSGPGPALVRGRDFRFRAGGRFETLPGGGQFGHSLDDFGRRFVCNNSDHIRHVVSERELPGTAPLASIAAEGPSGPVFRLSPPEPWRVVRTRWRVQGRAGGPIEHGGRHSGYFTSATGITIYRGTGLPDCYGNAFIGDVASNLVHRKRIRRDGVTFRAERADEGREFLASHDRWFRPVNFANGPDGALYVCDMYREVVEHPWSLPDEIRAHLDLENGNDRGRIWRVVREGAARPRRPALGAAGTSELVQALTRRDAWWRQVASRLLVEREVEDAAEELRRLLQADGAEVRATVLATMSALGVLDDDTLSRAIADRAPGVRELALELARRRSGSALRRAARGRLDDPEARVQMLAASSLRAGDEPTLRALARLAETRGGDPFVRAAILRAAHGAEARLFELTGNAPAAFRAELARWLASRRRAQAIVRDWLRDAEPGPETVPVAAGFARGRGARKEALLTPFVRWASRSVGDEAVPLDARVAAAELLGRAGAEDAVRRLAELLGPRVPSTLQLAAVRGLTRSAAGRGKLLSSWSRLSPTARRTAVDGCLRDAPACRQLLDHVERGHVPPRDLEASRRRALTAHRDARVRDKAAALLGRDEPTVPARVRRRFVAALRARPDAERGRAVYRQHCMTCHRLRGDGERVLGPDLETVQGWSAEAVLDHVLDPNRQIETAYLEYRVDLHGGESRFGRIASETASEIVLERSGGRERVARSDIAAIEATGVSIMPSGWERALSPAQMRDLIAWILE